MVTSSRRAGRVTNKTKLLIYRGSDKVDPGAAETIVWDSHDGGSESKHQHLGAKGVETGEMQEHHLQAALSSASLLHSGSTKPPSPTTTTTVTSRRPDASASASTLTATSSLNYHIPTPDATGLIETADYAILYQTHRYVEPTNYIRFSDTVEESSGGLGGLGYCMDDEDAKWLAGFNAKAEGTSGGEGSSGSGSGSYREKENIPVVPSASAGRERRKGKDREKEEGKGHGQVQAVIQISEDTFEYVMGVLEKHAEDSVPMLHTNLALLPPFSSVEPLFASAIPSSFFPSTEQPRGLPETKHLMRMAQCIYPHWRERREQRHGKTVMPVLNYDETNDGDPYVCFRRRDIRATRKTRRTDNFSVERMQKLQYELRSAHTIAQMVVRREAEKRALYKAEREVLEAKWKLFETKKRWPSLGLTREEEEIITGRQSGVAGAQALGAVAGPLASAGVGIFHPQSANLPLRKKIQEREKEEKERRDRVEKEREREKEKSSGMMRYYAPEEVKARMAALRQRLEEELAKKREADVGWDDATDSSYQPLPPSHASHALRPLSALDPMWSRRRSADSYDELPVQPPAFRLRRGRGGIIRLDRRNPVYSAQRGPPPSSPKQFSRWVFPDSFPGKSISRRPKSIDDVVEEPSDDEKVDSPKRRKLNEVWRYDSANGGALGVGFGLEHDDDRPVIDDFEPRLLKYRSTLLTEDDFSKLTPDMTWLYEAVDRIDEVDEEPITPIFVRPQTNATAQMLQMQQQQQQMQHQAQMEQLRYQMMAQQQAMAHQQAAALAAQQQQAQQQVLQAQHHQQQQQQVQGHAENQSHPVPSGPTQRAASDSSANGNTTTPSTNTAMLPPASTVRPNMKRPPSQNGANSNAIPTSSNMPPPAALRASVSPNNSMHPQVQGPPNGSPQVVNGMMMPPNGKSFVNGNGIQGQGGVQVPVDPATQQRLMQHARAMAAQVQLHAQAQAHGQAIPNGVDMDGNPIAINFNLNGLNGIGGMNGQMVANGNGVTNGSPIVNGNAPNGANMQHQGYTPEQYEHLLRAAQTQGFQNIQQFVAAQSKQRQMRPVGIVPPAQSQVQVPQGVMAIQGPGHHGAALSQMQQQQQPLSQQQLLAMAHAQAQALGHGHGNGNGQHHSSPQMMQQQLAMHAANGNGNANGIVNGGGNGNGHVNGAHTPGGTLPYQSPVLANASLQLKLPQHAAQRLAMQTQAGQRAA